MFTIQLYDAARDVVLEESSRRFSSEESALERGIKERPAWRRNQIGGTEFQFQARVLDRDGEVVSRYLQIEVRSSWTLVARGRKFGGDHVLSGKMMWIAVDEDLALALLDGGEFESLIRSSDAALGGGTPELAVGAPNREQLGTGG